MIVKDEELIQPAFQTRPYSLKDVVFIKDRWQSFCYISIGIMPVDMYVSNNKDLVMVFRKDESRDAYAKYRNREFQPERKK